MRFEFSLDELPAFAADFWKLAGDYRVFAFHGEMGSGKTTTIEALCEARGVRERMGSPTFSIINEYRAGAGEEVIYHIDLYRLKDEGEAIQAGVEDCITSGEICMVEWPEKAAKVFDGNTVHLYLEITGPDRRSIKMALPGSSMKEQS